MKKNKIILSVVTASCLLFSGLTAAAFERPEPVKFEKVQRYLSHAEPEQVTTNVLPRQIPAYVVKASNLKGYILVRAVSAFKILHDKVVVIDSV
ncbi:Uncharacterised protein [Yersinia intermedia]|nr:Uncharacterised protein [Yersinia intermedia]CNH24085.1 Uncharacterised protein [Yersinia intermedia]